MRSFATRRLRLVVLAACLALAPAASAGSRVIVSATLNSTLQFFDSVDFHELQPPLPSRGGGPVRLWVQTFPSNQPYGSKKFLLAANHGAVEGSLGVFDLSAAIVSEVPLSPFPAGPGSVGVTAGNVRVGGNPVPMAFVTNTVSAVVSITPLGCSLPKGSVTAFDASLLSQFGLVQQIRTVEISGPVPYAVSVSEDDGLAFVSSNCGNTLDTIAVTPGPLAYYGLTGAAGYQVAATASRPVGAGPDATLFDQDRGRSYTVNIGGDSLSVHSATSPATSPAPLTTVAIPNGGPIDANFGTGPSGQAWIVTANGQDDSVSLIDRDVIEQCIAALKASCDEARVLTVKTAVPGGAPEGIDYDPVMHRIFTVNKNIASPTLSVIQISEDPVTHALSGADIHRIPISLAGSQLAVPALIAFDVVVEKP